MTEVLKLSQKKKKVLKFSSFLKLLQTQFAILTALSSISLFARFCDVFSSMVTMKVIPEAIPFLPLFF